MGLTINHIKTAIAFLAFTTVACMFRCQSAKIEELTRVVEDRTAQLKDLSDALENEKRRAEFIERLHRVENEEIKKFIISQEHFGEMHRARLAAMQDARDDPDVSHWLDRAVPDAIRSLFNLPTPAPHD